MNKKSLFSIVLIIIVVCAVSLGGVMVWRYWKTPRETEINNKIVEKENLEKNFSICDKIQGQETKDKCY